MSALLYHALMSNEDSGKINDYMDFLVKRGSGELGARMGIEVLEASPRASRWANASRREQATNRFAPRWRKCGAGRESLDRLPHNFMLVSIELRLVLK